ncbi:MAG TPA: hypothetical protein VMU04_23245 [Candidatus Acidoferrum sp.]|nr:hypothetical protein [Candidatus Acidoferrum sp.]
MPENATPTRPNLKTRTVLFSKEKETKNAVKFAEVPVEGQAMVCGTLYLQKWFVGAAHNVKLAIEAQ